MSPVAEPYQPVADVHRYAASISDRMTNEVFKPYGQPEAELTSVFVVPLSDKKVLIPRLNL